MGDASTLDRLSLLAVVRWRDWRVRLLDVLVAAMFLWSSMYHALYEHYSAPLTATALALHLIGMRRICPWKSKGWPLGGFLVFTMIQSAV